MRYITVRTGLYEGKHKLYESVDEALEDNISPIEPWYDKQAVIGDWVVTDDGYTAQLLNRFFLYRKGRKKSNTKTEVFRIATGTSFVYYKADGSKTIRSLYGGQIQVSKNRLSNRSSIVNDFKARKNFIKLVAKDMPLDKAFKESYPHQKYNVNEKIKELIGDKQIFSLILKELGMGDFLVKMEERISKIKQTDLSSYLADRLIELLTTKKADIRHIKYFIELFGEDLSITPPKTKKDYIDADYLMVPPEELSAPESLTQELVPPLDLPQITLQTNQTLTSQGGSHGATFNDSNSNSDSVRYYTISFNIPHLELIFRNTSQMVL